MIGCQMSISDNDIANAISRRPLGYSLIISDQNLASCKLRDKSSLSNIGVSDLEFFELLISTLAAACAYEEIDRRKLIGFVNGQISCRYHGYMSAFNNYCFAKTKASLDGMLARDMGISCEELSVESIEKYVDNLTDQDTEKLSLFNLAYQFYQLNHYSP